jgi:hypothetical protein
MHVWAKQQYKCRHKPTCKVHIFPTCGSTCTTILISSFTENAFCFALPITDQKNE